MNIETPTTFAMYEVGDEVLINYGVGVLATIVWQLNDDNTLAPRPLFVVHCKGQAWFRDPKHVRPMR